MNLVREIKQYQATDGTCFSTRAEAEQYEEMLQNPHFKKLQERVEKLEAKNKDLSDKIGKLEIDLAALRTEVSAKSWFRDMRINRPPYQQPGTMLFDHQAYNTATGLPEQKDK